MNLDSLLHIYHRTCIYFDDETYKSLSDFCEKNDRSKAYVTRKAIKMFLQKENRALKVKSKKGLD